MGSFLLLFLTSSTAAQEKTALPYGAVARLGVSRLCAPEEMTAIGFTPDQRTFVAVYRARNDNEPNVILFDAATGLERKRLDVCEVRSVAMARAKPLMALNTHKGLEIWDLHAEKCIQRAPYAKLAWYATVLALSPDGTMAIAAVEKDNGVALLRWDTATGQALPAIQLTARRVNALCFSADGKKFFTSHWPRQDKSPKDPDRRVSIVTTWDARTGTRLAEAETKHDFVVFAADGARMACLGDNSIEVVGLDGPENPIKIARACDGAAFTPDGKQLVIACYNRPMLLWDLAAHKEVRTFEGKVGSMNLAPQFTQDGRLIAVRHYFHPAPDVVHFWDVATGKQLRFATGNPGPVSGIAYSPDGKRLATSSMDVIALYDPKTGEELHRWVGHKGAVAQIAFAPDGKLLASASADGTIALWDPNTAKLQRRLTARDAVKSIAFALDGTTLFAACVGQWVQSIDIATGKERSAFMGRETMTLPLFCPTGTLLAWQNEKDDYRGARGPNIHFLNPRTGKALPPIDSERVPPDPGMDVPRTGVSALAFSPDAKLVATCDSLINWSGGIGRANRAHTVRVWETATCQEILRFTGIPAAARIVAISPDNRVLVHALQGAGNLILRDLSSAQDDWLKSAVEEAARDNPQLVQRDWNKEFRTLFAQRGDITCVAFAPDSRFLATGADQVVTIWRVADFLKRSEPLGSDVDLAEFWHNLGNANARTAYRALAQMQARPTESLALLRKHLHPVATVDENTIRRHVRELGSANFATRQQANAALERAGDHAAPLLQEALKAPQGLEMKRRLEALLDKLDRPFEDADALRRYRALVLLERIGTSEARKHLEELARGAPTSWLTMEARHSLARTRAKE